MSQEKKIPDAQARAKSIARWREVNMMLDELNMTLELAMAQAEVDLQHSPLYVRRRERAKKLLATHQQQQLLKATEE